MIILDTSSLIRFFTNDAPKKANAVRDLIDSDFEKIIPEVVFPELEYVLLSKTYNSSRVMILKAFKFLIAHKTTITSKEVKKAVEIYEKTKLDMADCIVIAYKLVQNGTLATYDKELTSLTPTNAYWK